MSLARALTKRYRNHHHDEAPQTPSRMVSTRRFDKPIDRTQISLPVELLSTTNVLLDKAQDIHPRASSPIFSASSASSTKSFDESDASTGASSTSSISSPDFSRESSPTVVESNHLSSYFHPNITKSSGPPPMTGTRQSTASSDSEVPTIPQRALSHTKHTHQALARKRSQTRLSGQTTEPMIPPMSPIRTSIDLFSGNVEADHPFGAELEQVKELAEEYGAQDVQIWDEEEQFLVENGLYRFAVEDYVNEIRPLFTSAFDDNPYTPTTDWL